MFTLNEMNVENITAKKKVINIQLFFIITLLFYFLGFAKLQQTYAAWGCANKTGESACANGNKTVYYTCVKVDPGSGGQCGRNNDICDGGSWSANEQCSGGCDSNNWGGWSTCSKTCGGGTQSRTNACGTGQSQSCNTQACVVVPTAIPPTVIPTSVPPTVTPIPPTATPIPVACVRKAQGDANCDGKVDGIDYSLWLNTQCRPAAGQTCADTRADFNRDGKTDDDDYTVWFTNRGS